MRWIPAALALCIVCSGTAAGQARRKPRVTKAPPARTAPARVEAAALDCPTVLGAGVSTGRSFCDVLAGRDPAAGALIKIPPHKGTATLSFDLHNRQVYSAELERAGRSYTRATATIGVLTMDNTLLQRAVVQTDFRRRADLFDQIAAGPGTSGVKAVAPVGREAVIVVLDETVTEVSLLGEKLSLTRVDGTETITSPGRPIAVVSDVRIEYRPAPPPRPARRR